MMNFKHLRYFLHVADAGSVARASEQLHVSPQTISEQLQQLEDRLGGGLWQRQGRRLQLTEKGRMVHSYAREIFTLGAELEASVKARTPSLRRIDFRVGVADAVPKVVAHRLLAPVLNMGEHIRLICREWRLERLLSQLALHELDLVIADVPLPKSVSIKAFSHPLGGTGVSILGTPDLLAQWPGPFPQCLQGAPMLMPGEDAPTGHQLKAWFDGHGVSPRVVGEFDDPALAHEFGRHGAGFVMAPDPVADVWVQDFGMVSLGRVDGVQEHHYAISVERHIQHPCVIELTRAARLDRQLPPGGNRAAGDAGS